MSEKTKQALLRHNSQVPRYTSYPPANFFSEADDPDQCSGWIDSLPASQDLSLYIHIPFCPKMCWFCGCHTRATTHYAPVEDYLSLLLSEIEKTGARIGSRRKIKHIHFGGGSPTILIPEDFIRLMDMLRKNFSIDTSVQIAIEVDPRRIDTKRVQAYVSQGVDRVSLGVQDTHDIVMRAINRVQPFHQVSDAVSLCRDAGVDHINIDLVYGLPHQTVSLMEETVCQVLTLSPDRLALFGYAHVPWMKRHMRLIKTEDLPDSSLRYDLFTKTAHEIEQSGYIPIGIDHFSKTNDALAVSVREKKLSRNFQGYVPFDENLPIIGLGVSAISSLPMGYMQNISDALSYKNTVLSDKTPLYRFHKLTRDDHIRSAVIEDLMCYSSVDLEQVCRDFSINPDYFSVALARLDTLERDGLVKMRGKFSLHVQDRLAVRLCAAVFDAYRVPETAGRHAIAV